LIQSLLDALAVEGMLAREDVEFFVKDGLEAKVTRLTWIDRDTLMLHFPLLAPQVFRILR